jgi:hypothetical protein
MTGTFQSNPDQAERHEYQAARFRHRTDLNEVVIREGTSARIRRLATVRCMDPGVCCQSSEVIDPVGAVFHGNRAPLLIRRNQYVPSAKK